MKDTIKNSIIGAFAIFGFVALISSYSEYGAYEPKGVWEMHIGNDGRPYSLNATTGEVRKYNIGSFSKKVQLNIKFVMKFLTRTKTYFKYH
jgi:hypothetical protein